MQIKKLEEDIKKCKKNNEDTEMRHMKAVKLVQDQVVKIEKKNVQIVGLEKRKSYINDAYAHTCYDALDMHLQKNEIDCKTKNLENELEENRKVEEELLKENSMLNTIVWVHKKKD